MAVGAFPLAKLGALFLKQLSKPLANKLKIRAKNSPFFRRWVCMPPAQFYHWCEVKIKVRILNLGKPSAVKPLNEREAIDLGAELLGEAIIFAVAAGTITAEYLRQSRNERAKEETKEDRYHRLTHELEELQLLVARQEVEIRHLSRLVGTPVRQIVPVVEPNPAARKEGSTYVSLDQAVENAKAAMGKEISCVEDAKPSTSTAAGSCRVSFHEQGLGGCQTRSA
ncbi:optic atrophy 3 protein homolog isoform X2 [Varroa jacobsoni]|uniref:OPA3-like protein n=1 Tax=Varroa destructor TaxID=109461 RepID=A0A7M7KDK8_VARDE|nr:optic atrophy 3 protein homolog isoform X2 [Varroa destructor]XP_022707309.1 optic atrophy 3 protein homolog isoform X2 [Varroa jacobsoni]